VVPLPAVAIRMMHYLVVYAEPTGACASDPYLKP
jgi:hypothetical protein